MKRGRPRTLPDAKCIYCGAIFHIFISKNANKFCSRECDNDSRKATSWQAGRTGEVAWSLISVGMPYKQVMRAIEANGGPQLSVGQFAGALYRMRKALVAKGAE